MPLTCTASDIAEAAKCFQNYCINEADRLAIAVLFKANQLVTAGGTNYVTTGFDALIADSVGIISIGHNEMSAEELALMQDATTGAPDTVNELLAAVSCLRCQPLKVLRKALLFLQCAITAEG
jgi:hypothetical protein